MEKEVIVVDNEIELLKLEDNNRELNKETQANNEAVKDALKEIRI